MAAITATYLFTPSAGTSIVVNGNSESEIKAAVKAVLEARKAAQQAAIVPLEQALSEMDA